MTVMASRSSTTARVRGRSVRGRKRAPITASTARAKAMSAGLDRPPDRRAALAAGVEAGRSRRDDDPSDGGGDRQRGPSGVPQATADELTLQLQSGDEEEDRQQPVAGPLGQGQVQMHGGRPDLQRRESRVDIGSMENWAQTSARVAATMKQGAADGLGAQDVSDPADFGPAAPVQEADGNVAGRCAHVAPRSGVDNRIADQTSRHTTRHPRGRPALRLPVARHVTRTVDRRPGDRRSPYVPGVRWTARARRGG